MVGRLYTLGHIGTAAWATSATPLPMWDVERSSMVPWQGWYLFHVTESRVLAYDLSLTYLPLAAFTSFPSLLSTPNLRRKPLRARLWFALMATCL
jgi:hypothetical protein